MAVEDSNTQRAIGRLEGKMEEVINLLKESSASRAKLYEGLEAVRSDIGDMDNRLEKVEGAIHIMDPLVKEFGNLKERWRGIVLVVAVVWLILGGAVMNGITWIVGLLWRAIGPGS